DVIEVVRDDLLQDARLNIAELPDITLGLPQALAVIVVRNLLDNALKHSPETGGVDLEVALANEYVVLSVSDRGDWPENGDTDYLTRRFWRSADGRSKQGGSGLGLTLVAAVVERFRGRLEFESRPRGGLRVRLALPQADRKS